MLKVLVESPFKGKDKDEEARNVRYARACLHDCFKRGEAPFASHLLYTQPGVLDDDITDQRTLGINAGLLWGEGAEKTVVYEDLGISTGMLLGIERAAKLGRPVEYRRLFENGIPQEFTTDFYDPWKRMCPGRFKK